MKLLAAMAEHIASVTKQQPPVFFIPFKTRVMRGIKNFGSTMISSIDIKNKSQPIRLLWTLKLPGIIKDSQPQSISQSRRDVVEKVVLLSVAIRCRPSAV